jgi:hypothetical protein
MSYNPLASCAQRAGIARIVHPGSKHPVYKLIPFRCGKSSCPICRNIKRKRLLRRLKAASWPKDIVMWTITTDPKLLSSAEAISTISRRWHLVSRELLRHYPGLKYFKVLEFTKSGLPHFHVMFDHRVSWHLFQNILIQHNFGQVLHFLRLPRDQALSYLTKYVTKSLESYEDLKRTRLRSWTASLRFIPKVSYFQDGVEFQIVYDDHLGFRLESMLHYYQLYGQSESL